MKIYGAIEKIEPQDDGTLFVHGIASTEDTDSVGEIIRADAMRRAIPGYTTYPALREMHGLSAAGTTTEIDVGEDNITRIIGHVVDPIAIKKVETGTYRGFSIGGKVLKRDPNDRKVITEIDLREISLVDRPCNGACTLSLLKVGGLDITEDGDLSEDDETDVEDEKNAAAAGESSEEGEEAFHREFDDVAKREFSATQRKKDAKSGAAMKDGSFPIQSKQDLKNAIRLAGKAKDPAAARAHIKRRAKALGAEDMIPDTWKDAAAKAATTEFNKMAAKKPATAKVTTAEDAEAGQGVSKTVEPAPINASQVSDVMNDGAGNGDATGQGEAVAGKKITPPALPDGGPAVPVAVPNPEEAGQATPAPLGETPVAPVEHVAGQTPVPGTDKRTRKQAAAEGAAVTGDSTDGEGQEAAIAKVDPVAAAREAADRALKAATAVMEALSKRDGAVPAPLRAGMELRKGMYTVGRLASLLCELAYMVSDTKWEADAEGDGSPIPAQLNEHLKALSATYRAMSEEELNELLTAADKNAGVDIALAAAGGDLAKALEGAVSEEELAKLGDAEEGDALAKAEDRISALEDEREELLKTVTETTSSIEALAKAFEDFKNEPAPPKTIAMPAGVSSVSKTEDAVAKSAAAAPVTAEAPSQEDVAKALAAMSDDDRALLLLKMARHPSQARVITR